ncbi:glycosyltransferase family 32 protein [Acidomonas methanolica]|uniref:glycosyltransferase family 32 protein n=1 Tax=Acidomonas methanolica TaxID=437 RepID=UPI002119DAB9|nr:glycosyltransferase [Acidomonas methanolica]MCQ9157222.1 hypothetical protein [Acidomonas methanolica]
MSKKQFHNIDYVHQILISSSHVDDHDSFDGIVGINVAEAKRIYSDSKYIFWQDADIKLLIEKNFDESVLECYNKLKANAFKADLARYCILYVMGGIYVDLGIRLINTWDIPKSKGFAAFKELNFTSDSWTIMQNGLIWSEKGRRELQVAINWIVENYKNKFYGANPLYPTGPILFGRSIAYAMSERKQSDTADDQFIGEYRWTTPEHGIKNDAYVSPDHKLVAFRTKTTAGDLSHLGLNGTNNYKEIWLSRQVYGETIAKFRFSNTGNYYDDRLKIRNGKRTSEGFHVSERFYGTIIYGPYIKIDIGRYRINLFIESHSKSEVTLKVTSGGGRVLLAEERFQLDKSNDFIKLQSYFYTSEARDLFEVVLISDGSFSGIIKGYDIENIYGENVGYCAEDLSINRETDVINAVFHKKWGASSLEIKNIIGKKTIGGILVEIGSKGRVTYGPYAFIPKGKYEIIIKFRKNSVFRRLYLELACDQGNRVLYNFKKRYIFKSEHSEVKYTFLLEKDVVDIEFRVGVDGDFDGVIESFEVRGIQSRLGGRK